MGGFAIENGYLVKSDQSRLEIVLDRRWKVDYNYQLNDCNYRMFTYLNKFN